MSISNEMTSADSTAVVAGGGDTICPNCSALLNLRNVNSEFGICCSSCFKFFQIKSIVGTPKLVDRAVEKPAKSTNVAQRIAMPIGRSFWAILAGYFGLLSPIPFFGPIAVCTGILGWRSIKRVESLHGAGRSWFGIVAGSIATVVYLIMGFYSIAYLILTLFAIVLGAALLFLNRGADRVKEQE